MSRLVLLLVFMLFLSSLAGCQTAGTNSKNKLNDMSMTGEAVWIRNGGAIEFEGKKWVAQDGIESLQDDEVFQMGEYKGVPFFIDKIDVRPFNRLYTKFGKNKYRYYKVK